MPEPMKRFPGICGALQRRSGTFWFQPPSNSLQMELLQLLTKEMAMARVDLASIMGRSAVAGLVLAALGAFLGPDGANAQGKTTASEKSLYERLGGVFAIAAVVDHFSDASSRIPSLGRSPRIRSCESGTPRTSEGCPVSSSCERYGSATFREVPSSSWRPSPARRCLVSRKPTGTSAFLPQNSMRSRRSSANPRALQGAEAREGRGPDSLRRSQGRDYRRLRRVQKRPLTHSRLATCWPVNSPPSRPPSCCAFCSTCSYWPRSPRSWRCSACRRQCPSARF